MEALKNNYLFRTQGFINGEWIDSDEKFDVLNPFNNQVIAQVSDLGVEHTRAAIDAAQGAFVI